MSADIVLSICIPTFNFGDVIAETLQSICPQATAEVEIVVVDGASTDRTAEVVAPFAAKYRNLIYRRLPRRGGIDRDMAACVDLARGRYCWLFSADDLMRSGSVAKAMEWIQSGSDLYICKHTNCTREMRVLHEVPVLSVNGPRTFELANSLERTDYFERAQSTEAFFSFMGTLIVRRDSWCSVPLDERFVGSCWAHVARMFTLVSRGMRLTYVPEVWLDRRGDHDSFSDKGVVNRYRIAIEGYQRLAEVYFGQESAYAFDIRRTLRNEFGVKEFLSARASCILNPAGESMDLLKSLVARTYIDVPFEARILMYAISLAPIRVYLFARMAWRRHRRRAHRETSALPGGSFNSVGKDS